MQKFVCDQQTMPIDGNDEPTNLSLTEPNRLIQRVKYFKCGVKLLHYSFLFIVTLRLPFTCHDGKVNGVESLSKECSRLMRNYDKIMTKLYEKEENRM